jgi:hypothetical protein
MNTITSTPSDSATCSITVHIGEGEHHVSHVLDGYMLSNSTSYFNDALSQDGPNYNITIPNASPKAFGTYITFLQSQNEAISISSHESETGFDECLSLFKLAQLLRAPAFHYAVIDAFLGFYTTLTAARNGEHVILGEDFVNTVYAHFEVGSMVRKLVVDVNLFAWDAESCTSYDFSAYDKEYLSNFIEATGPYLVSQEDLIL